MEGLYFYWLAWIGWVWTTFFMNKYNPLRLKWTVMLLAVIFAAPFTVDVLIFELHLSAFAIAIFIFLETRRKKTGSFLYLFLSAFIIMLAYTSFLMFELFDRYGCYSIGKLCLEQQVFIWQSCYIKIDMIVYWR